MTLSKGVDMDWLPLVCRFALGALFLWTGAAKFANRVTFQEAVRGYAVIPAWSARWVSATVPVAEILLGLTLLLGVGTGVAAATAAGLLSAFAAAMAVNLSLGKRTACGCGTGPGQRVSWRAVVRNLVLVAVAAVVAVAPATPLSVEPNPSGALSAGEAWIMVLSAGLAAQLAAVTIRTYTVRRSSRELVRT